MGKTVTIASRIPMAIRIEEPEGNPDKPGLSKDRQRTVIKGAGNDLGTVEGLTAGVDEDLFDAWVKANPNHGAVVNGLLRKVGAEEQPQGITYGFEAASEKAPAEDSKAPAKSKT
ncbi:hypothetical protein [Bosea sp. UNC402CLCol]|uniref:hypothetical protein n=1 Tax=Bosea sp. UNC402CLCol TaxID=1510531 RepID=UPI00056FB94C|nr:hypothetical protein [Bosea sp. UNC402CLCol]